MVIDSFCKVSLWNNTLASLLPGRDISRFKAIGEDRTECFHLFNSFDANRFFGFQNVLCRETQRPA